MRRSHPKLRRHKPSSRAVVTLSGKDHYLGAWPANRRTPPADVQAEYDRLILEWLAGGFPALGGTVAPAAPKALPARRLTVEEVLAEYWQHAESYYRKPDGTPTAEMDCIRAAMRPVRRLYADVPAADFSPLKLRAVQEAMIADGLARTTVNKNVDRVRRIFRWAVARELIPPSVCEGLRAVPGLKAGRTTAREPEPVRPVNDVQVEQVVGFLPPALATMVRLQRLTGMRSGELCVMRPADIDRAGPVWLYRPRQHKTAHRGHDRVVAIGPSAQQVLLPIVDGTGPEDFLFSPARWVAEQNAQRSAKRKTKRWPSHMRRNAAKRKARRKRPPGRRYHPQAYRLAILRACDRAFPPPGHLARRTVEVPGKRPRKETPAEWRARLGPAGLAELRAWHKAHRWHPHRLRHATATEIRRRFGAETARTVLGHAELSATEIYSEMDVKLATRVAAELG